MRNKATGINRVELKGNLVDKPELRSGTDKKGREFQNVTFTIAINEGEDKVTFIDCVAWYNEKNLLKDEAKGSFIHVTGKLRKYSYENEYGDKKWITQVIVDMVKIIYSKKKQSEEPAFE